MEKYTAIKQRAEKYRKMLQQVVDFRSVWEEQLKEFIKTNAEAVLKHTDTDAKIEIEEKFEHLESVTISLGKSISGIAENIDKNTKRNIVKDNGSLIYSQLFNGKVQVWLTYPLIEGLMQPKEPKMIGIYAPPEFNEGLILSNFDDFFKELIDWENYDDDKPGQAVTRIGFGGTQQEEE